jgi:hypothetical protein
VDGTCTNNPYKAGPGGRRIAPSVFAAKDIRQLGIANMNGPIATSGIVNIPGVLFLVIEPLALVQQVL